MKRIFLLAVSATVFSACVASGPDTQISELDNARMWIEKARQAGAEQCTPELQAKAVARLHHAAHEYDEKHYHPDENSELAAAAVSYAKKAYEKTESTCNKPKPVAKAKPVMKPVMVKPAPRVIPKLIRLSGVFFETNSAVLMASSQSVLNGAVATLKQNPSIHVEVAAHTDSRGRDAYNMKLSNKRANSVMDYLTRHGIDAGRMHARGYGETMPVADNNTEEGRAKNRRVELRVAK
ncbi:MAG: OmpA family protein [Mariprofundaceae bacterium]|nr:OmpA family protein [Mariprofundaceae bacterium]